MRISFQFLLLGLAHVLLAKVLLEERAVTSSTLSSTRKSTTWSSTRITTSTSRTGTSTRTSSTTSRTPTPAPTTISTNGRCANGVTCMGSNFGPCCSREGFCGNAPEYCAPYTCQRAWGGCDNWYTHYGDTRSTNGTCGGKISCEGAGFGNCCSQWGTCGDTPAHCGLGCKVGLGRCDTVSTDGSCGSGSARTCRFSGFGNCCSANGRCGSTDAFCGSGCQSNAGDCW
ncbi:hypothetical protein B0H63DRAFT_448940 [Podospora didyma]|uniref:Chitin-binding type-1 domain-containing protein n=1 Tax=Podospora didyma TaxID=330526 RepID=A0AAE0NNL4_9PEZI|nr:hypothetical protein B0H63DRAFT_448940 [Podospora didyma]